MEWNNLIAPLRLPTRIQDGGGAGPGVGRAASFEFRTRAFRTCVRMGFRPINFSVIRFRVHRVTASLLFNTRFLLRDRRTKKFCPFFRYLFFIAHFRGMNNKSSCRFKRNSYKEINVAKRLFYMKFLIWYFNIIFKLK